MKTLIFCLVALLAPVFATADTGSDWAPETFTLDNGMEVVVLPDHRAPVVMHMVWYKVGAVDEEPGKSGLAHLFEHVMFKETDDLGPEEFTTVVQRNGGQLNAFTSWDYTAYFERVAKDRLELMMSMEADRMTDLILNDDPEGSFYVERDTVKEERRQRVENNPGSILFEKVMAALYPDHPYGVPIIGHMDEVAALTVQDGLDFYETWYAPQQAILVVAGDVTAADVRPLAEATYGVL
ncbi:MAG: pitrilysin family protein, partial [Pseudomonadota bacterium]